MRTKKSALIFAFIAVFWLSTMQVYAQDNMYAIHIEFAANNKTKPIEGVGFKAVRFMDINYHALDGWKEKDVSYEKIFDDPQSSALELKEIEEKGIDIARVTLHVGLGTFRPVKTENILEHHMHSEFYTVTQEAADKINTARKNGGKIIAVGTTSTRTLESVGTEDGTVKACSGWTQIFIYPGYQFKVIDSLITNFHLPESTLVMLVSALAGREHVLAAYEEAVKEKYRFFSFGDAMLIK